MASQTGSFRYELCQGAKTKMTAASVPVAVAGTLGLLLRSTALSNLTRTGTYRLLTAASLMAEQSEVQIWLRV